MCALDAGTHDGVAHAVRSDAIGLVDRRDACNGSDSSQQTVGVALRSVSVVGETWVEASVTLWAQRLGVPVHLMC